jgi:nucleotide-binding universal stress UspA family protein
MNRILLPINFPYIAQRVVHQAAFLARHFNAEILLLHVVPPLSYPYGILERGHDLTERDLHADVIVRAQRDLDQATLPELDGIAVKRLLLRGEPAHEITRIAREEKVNLIAMSTHGHNVLYRFLLGSVAAKVLHDSDCLVLTDTHLEEARLTLVHITSAVEGYGPGGSHVIPALKEALVSYATAEIATLQQQSHTSAEVIIDSGDVRKMLNRAAVRLRHLYFPTTSIVSLQHVLTSGEPTEIAVVGNEGVVGIALLMADGATSSRAVVRAEGGAYRLRAEILEQEFGAGTAMHIESRSARVE